MPPHSTRLRLATPADGPRLAEIYRPAVVDGVTSFELEPPDGAEMGRRVQALLARTPWLVAELEGRVQGYAYASPHRDRPAYGWSVEVSAYVDPSHHRGGVGRGLYATLFGILALQGLQTAYAGITLPNAASVGFHRAMGFADVGTYHRVGFKRGAWHDVMWLVRPLGAYPVPPAPVRPLPSLLTDPALQALLSAGG